MTAKATLSPISVKPKEASEITGICRTNIYAAINRGELKALKRGRSTLLMVDDLRRWIENSPELRPPKAQLSNKHPFTRG